MSSLQQVAFFTPGWPAGDFPNGIVTYVGNLRQALPAMGIDSWVLAAAVSPGLDDADCYPLITDRPRSAGRKLVRAIHARLAPDAEFVRSFGQCLIESVSRYTRHRPTQILEIEESFGAAYFLTRARLLPVVVRLHGPWFLNGVALGVKEDASFRRRVAAEGRAIVAADAVSSPSLDVLNRVRRRYDLELANARVIPNPARAFPTHLRWSLERAEQDRVLFVGRFDRHKGGDLMIEAFASLARRRPGAKLWFVGPDRGYVDSHYRRWSLPEFIQDRVPELEVRRRIEVLGQLSPGDVDDLRGRAMVTVLPSRYENVPLTALEALSSGAPLVAAAVGGTTEVIRGDQTGILVKPRDAEALAASVELLLAEPQRCAALSLGAQAERRFDPAEVARQTVELYGHVRERWTARR